MATPTFRMDTPLKEIEQYVDDQMEIAKDLQLQMLDIAGEIAVKNQTLAHKYLNQTGNLSSSIGYVVLDEGRVWKSGGFAQTGQGSEGAKEGSEFINSLKSQNSKGIALIVVAGMNYAVYVENMGLDVLTTAELVAEKTVNKLIKQIG